MKNLPFEVYLNMYNYQGDITDSTLIAAFRTRNWANKFLDNVPEVPDGEYVIKGEGRVGVTGSDDVDDAWDNHDPYSGKIYRVTGGYETKATNYPKNAIEYWFKFQKKYPMDVMIMCQNKVDAVKLVEWAANNVDYMYKLAEKFPTPYKPEYIVSECEKKAADGCKWFHEGEYGDSIHPFGVG